MGFWKKIGKILAIIFVPGVMTAAAVVYLIRFFVRQLKRQKFLSKNGRS
jgi:hypothetical protein